MRLKNVFRSEWFIGSILALEDDGGFEDLDSVPLSHGNGESINTLLGVEVIASRLSPLVIVEDFVHATTQDDDDLGALHVAMDGQHGVGFQSIQHSLRLVGRGGAEVKVHAQAFGGTSPLRQFIQ